MCTVHWNANTGTHGHSGAAVDVWEKGVAHRLMVSGTGQEPDTSGEGSRTDALLRDWIETLDVFDVSRSCVARAICQCMGWILAALHSPRSVCSVAAKHWGVTHSRTGVQVKIRVKGM